LGKLIVLGILERNNRIFTTIVPNVRPETLLKEIQKKTERGSVFYTDKFRSYHDLKLFGRQVKINK
jgi:transposase-like protein